MPLGAAARALGMALLALLPAAPGRAEEAEAGQGLRTPDRAVMEAVPAAQAGQRRRGTRSILRQRYADVIGAPAIRAGEPALPAASPDRLAEQYRSGQRLEKDGRLREAMGAYLEAARSGHGPAQKRLGVLYGRGSPEVPRDYAESVQWYERARRSGEDVAEPLQFTTPR